MSYVDFGEIKARVTIADALQMLCIDNQRFKQTARDQLRGCCPIHNGDNPRGFIITPSKALWHCFGGCGGADSGGSRPRIRDDLARHSDLISLGVPR